MNDRAAAAELYDEIDALIGDVGKEADARIGAWRDLIEDPDFRPSAANLAAYLSVRHRDLRETQRRLMVLGLSSLGRLESRVMPTLAAVRAALGALAGRDCDPAGPSEVYFAGERRLDAHARAVLGEANERCPIAVLVTCPTEAADDPDFMLNLARRGVEAVRINCAHDDEDVWARMIGHVKAAAAESGHRMKVFMDLAGPKIRTGKVEPPKHGKKIRKGDVLAVVREGDLGRIDCDTDCFGVECTLAGAVAGAELGDRIFVDDGKLSAEVEKVQSWGLLARVSVASEDGLKLKGEKALNFPDTDLEIDALTEQDRSDLEFIAAHADGIEYSFVQSAKDVRLLQAALAQVRPDDWRDLALILKIETAQAVAALPDLIVQAAGRQPTAVMIARGDLSVEIGFARTAEIQEEILWLGEAAAVPVIWATQVLEDLVKTGASSRGEMTDAAMAARADCVMLNKGPYVMEAIDQLQVLLRRMEDHQHKKASMLRRLRTW